MDVGDGSWGQVSQDVWERGHNIYLFIIDQGGNFKNWFGS